MCKRVKKNIQSMWDNWIITDPAHAHMPTRRYLYLLHPNENFLHFHWPVCGSKSSSIRSGGNNSNSYYNSSNSDSDSDSDNNEQQQH